MQNLEVMVMLFTMVILGYTACKLGYMGDKFDKKLSSIVVDITCPLLVLSSVMGDEMPDRSLILPLVGVGFLTYIILLVFGFWVPRFISRNHDDQGMIGFSLMFANVGFIGYPIVASIFGPKAVFYAALLNVPNTFFIFTAGVMLVKGEYSIRQFNPKVLLSPALIGAFIAALLVAFGVHTPEMIARPITMVGNITVPAALMIIGSSMARLPLREIIGSGKVYATSFLRLVIVPLSVYFLFIEVVYILLRDQRVEFYGHVVFGQVFHHDRDLSLSALYLLLYCRFYFFFCKGVAFRHFDVYVRIPVIHSLDLCDYAPLSI